MNPPGNSASGKTPPSPQNQTQLQWPGQPHVTANNESHTINEPSLPLHDAGGTRAPPSWSQQSQLRIQEPSQRPPIIANQESHVINEPFQPPHHAAGGRITPPLSSRQHGIQEPGQPPPSRANNESLITIRQPWRPLYSAGRRTSLESLQDQLLQYQQRSPRVNQESHTIKKHKRPPQHASGRQCPHHIVKNHKEFKELVQRLTGQRSSSGTQLGQGRPRKSSSSTPPTTTSQSPVVPKTTPFVGHDDIGNNSIPVTVSPTASEILADIESAPATLDEDKSSSSSSTSPYGLSQVPNTLLSNQSNDPRSCAKCGNTSTTQWRNDPRGPKSLCNACGIRFNRKEETRTATASVSSGFQSSDILLPPGMSLPAAPSFEQEAPYGFSHLQNRVQLMDNVSENSLLRFLSKLQSSSVVSPPPEMSAPAAPSLTSRVQLAENILLGDPSRSQSSSPSRDPPEVASMMEEFRQSLTKKTPHNSPGP